MAIRVPNISKVQLSDSTDGLPILIAQTATAGDSLHDATGDTDVVDELHIWAHNISASAVELTLEIGGTGAANQRVISIPAKSSVKVVDGDLVLSNSQNIAAFAGTTNVINITGYALRIDQSGG